jgi:hypothetical protein
MPAGRFVKFSFAAARRTALVMICVMLAVSGASFYRRWRHQHPCRHERATRLASRADKVRAGTKPPPKSSHAEYGGKIRAAKSAAKLLKSFARVNLCARASSFRFAGLWQPRTHRLPLREQPGDIDRDAGDERRGKQPVG